MSSSKDVAGKIQGFVVSLRTGPRTQKPNECIIRFPEVKNVSQAAKLVGRKVTLSYETGQINGKIVSLHGKNGMVRARFRRGVPGQTGLRVEIKG
jgi:large subunit ribosomal protein L35Ae